MYAVCVGGVSKGVFDVLPREYESLPLYDFGDACNEYGLFGRNAAVGTDVKTVMAHCVWSTDEEVELMRRNGVFVAHCPASNMNLTSGIAPIRRYLDRGLRVGLGSDVAGGHSDSIFRAVYLGPDEKNIVAKFVAGKRLF